LRASGVPDDVATFVQRLMSKRPEDRPASAAEVREALRALEVSAPLPEAPSDAADVVDAQARATAPRPAVEPARWRVSPVPTAEITAGTAAGRRRRVALVPGALAAAVALLTVLMAAARGDEGSAVGASPTVTAPATAPATAPSTATTTSTTTATTTTT